MGTLMKRHLVFVGSFVGTSLMGLTYLVVGIPKYFFGDDFLLLNASRREGGYASSISSCVSDIGMGKWRPMFSCIASPMLKLFGDQYWYYFLTNLALIFFVCVVAGNLLQRIAKFPKWNAAFFAFVLPFSRFAWYGRVSPYGVMEFGALLFALLFLRQCASALARQTRSSWYIAGGLVCLSALFHERYLVLLGSLFLVSILNVRNKRTPVPIVPWILFSGLYLAVKVFLLQTDPFIGGGEVALRSSAGTWILEHFLVGLKAIVGIGNGTNINFDQSGYMRLPGLGASGMVWLVALVLSVLIILTWKATIHQDVFISKSDISKELVEQQIIMRQLLATSALLLIIPASTIISRIEGRWLLGPEVFLFILVIGVLKSQKCRIVFMSCYLIFNVTCLKFLPDYERPLRSTNEILQYVDEKLDGRAHMVYTVIDPRGHSVQLDWQLGLNNKFKQLGVKSILYVDDASCTGSCIRIVLEDTEHIKLITNP